MENFERKKYLTAIQSALEKEKIVLLTGARQVGKTTLLRMIEERLEKAVPRLYLNLEDLFGKVFSTKQEFIQYVQFEYGFDLTRSGVLFLDEIQYLKEPESLLKSLYDDSNIRVKIIATGSRFWGQKKVGSTLVGRGAIIPIYSLCFEEFLLFRGKSLPSLSDQNEFSANLLLSYWQEYLRFGGYPAVVKAQTKARKLEELSKIIDRFFERDFTYFMKTGDIIQFKKVFQYLSLNIKNTIKVDKIASELGIGRYRVDGFLQFLRDSYLVQDVFPYYQDKAREYSQNPEVYFMDTGILNYISGQENVGLVTENAVFLECLKCENTKNVYFYKKTSGSEIDFIVETRENILIPIEVKSANKDIIPRIFFSFADDYPTQMADGIVTTQTLRKTRTLSTDNVKKTVEFVPGMFLAGFIR